jgi:hypothetical protein
MERKKYDLNILKKYIKDGRIEKNDHPTLPISIYNYTRETQYNNDWDGSNIPDGVYYGIVAINLNGQVVEYPFMVTILHN